MVAFADTSRFQVVRRLGAGGLGEVYEVVDHDRGTPVALKVLRHVSPGTISRFKKEFRSLCGVSHPNLATLYELLSTGDQWLLTMELIHGVTFLHYVRGQDDLASADTVLSGAEGERNTVIPARPFVPRALSSVGIKRLRALLPQLIAGVSALHDVGKLHRDIKPSNVLVTHQGRVVLVDFGLIGEIDELSHVDVVRDPSIVGTAEYMAPELAGQHPLSKASDWYSVGVMLYEALTGRRPFVGSMVEVLAAKRLADPLAPRELWSAVPDDLNDLCQALLEREPTARPDQRQILAHLGIAGESPRSLRSQDNSAAPFVGRIFYLERLWQSFRAVCEGQPVAVRVFGVSGVGKSSLVREFLRRLRLDATPSLILTARCYEGESMPFKAVDSIVDQLTRHLGSMPRNELAELLPDSVAVLARVFPAVRQVDLIAERADNRRDRPGDLADVRQSAFASFRDLMLRLATRYRVVIFIDDLHWGDCDSAELLAGLLHHPQAPPLLLVSSFLSSEQLGAQWQHLFSVDQLGRSVRLAVHDLPLGPLAPWEIHDMAETMLGKVDARTSAALTWEAEGIPIFVEQMVRFGELRAGNHAAAAEDPSQGVCLGDVLGRWFEALSAEAMKLLEVIAVAAGPIAQVVAERAAGLADARSALAALRAGNLIRSRGTRRCDLVEIYHERIRAAVVARLGREELTRCHRRLATALELVGSPAPELLAAHWEGGGDPLRAARLNADAARESVQTLAFARAADLFRRSLLLDPAGGGEANRIRIELADALANAGRGAEAARVYLEAAAAAGCEAFELRRRAADQFLRSGCVDDALEVIPDLIGAAGAHFPARGRCALTSVAVSRAKVALRGFRFRARPDKDVPRPRLARIDVCFTIGLGLSMVDPIGAASLHAQGLLAALRAGEPVRVARAFALEAAFQAMAGRRGQKRADWLLDRASELAEQYRDPRTVALVVLHRAHSAFLHGYWARAHQHAAAAETMFVRECPGSSWEQWSARAFANAAAVNLGQLHQLAAELPSLVQRARECGDLYALTSLQTGPPIVCWLAYDDPAGARKTADHAIAAWSQRGFHIQHYVDLVAQTQIDLYGDDPGDARRRLASAWRPLHRSQLLRVQLVRCVIADLRARAAVAAALGAPPSDREHLLAEASRWVRRIRGERAHWALPVAASLRASMAAVRGDQGEVVRQLGSAAKGYDHADMALCAAVSRIRLGALLAGTAGRQLEESGRDFLRTQRVVNAERFCEMMNPGFVRR